MTLGSAPLPPELSARLAQLSPERRALVERALRDAAAKASVHPSPDAIARTVEPGDNAPLSYTQELLWMFERASPHVAMYNSPRIFRLRGALNVGALRHALDAHLARHHVYHTRIVEDQAGVHQRVYPARPVVLDAIDLRHELSGLDSDARDLIVESRLRAAARAPFDLEGDQLLRGTLFSVDSNEWVLLLVSHHIASDDWSRGVMFREIERLYAAAVSGEQAELAPMPIQYADYARWQREHLSGASLERVLDFWRRELAGAPAKLELPTDRPSVSVPAGTGARMLATWPPALGAQLRALASHHDATLFMTLLAAWQILLARLSGQVDVVVGTPIAGRDRPELENVVGYFADTLVIRGRLAGAPTFVEHLARVRASCLAAFEHRDVPYEKLLVALASERGERVSTIFHSLFTVHADAAEQFCLPNVEIESLVLDVGISKADVSLAVRADADGGMRAMLEYRTELFDTWRMVRMHEQLRTLLEGIVANPEQRVSQLPLLNASQRRELDAWNETTQPFSDTSTLGERIEACIDAHRETVSLQFGANTVSFAELDVRANKLAHHLMRAGVKPGVGVALCFDRSFALVVCMVATLKAGGHYVPLDPAYPPDRLAYMLDDSAAGVLLTDAAHRGLIPEKVGGPARILLDDAWSVDGLLASELSTRPSPTVTPDDLAYVIYTSGSTGQPKGVMIPNRAVVNYLEWMQRATAIGPADCVLQKAPASFDASIWEFFLPLVSGARLLLAQPGGHQDPDYLLSTIVRDGVTVMQLVPSQLQMILETPGAEALSRLRLLVCGGEALPGDFVARLDRIAPVAMLNLYGPTEATVYATWWAHDARVDGPWDGSPIPIGRPTFNTRIHLVDAAMQLVPVGVPGELLIGGVQVARGYHARPALTTEKFITDPFSTRAGDRLYRTGDLACWRPDGVLEYLGRIDNQVKVRGFRIELGEIEEALGRHAAVLQCVVVVREDAPGEKRLVAYVVLQGDGEAATPAALREFLLTGLPHYMVPSSIDVLAAIPMNANGKADRNALPAPSAERVANNIAPRTLTEQAIAEIWRDVFALPAISVDAGFLDLGGHSLLAIRILSRMRRELDVIIPLDALLRGGSIAHVASLMDDLRRQPAPVADDDLALVPVSRESFRRLKATPGGT